MTSDDSARWARLIDVFDAGCDAAAAMDEQGVRDAARLVWILTEALTGAIDPPDIGFT